MIKKTNKDEDEETDAGKRETIADDDVREQRKV